MMRKESCTGRGKFARDLANLLARGEKADFPMIGKNFPVVGKLAPFFPMIGKLFSNGWKIWAGFSNDWKNFSAVFQ